MTDREQNLLVALVLMVNQYMDEHGDEVDSLSESAGEHAIAAPADYGLMEVVDTALADGRKRVSGFVERRPEYAHAQPDPSVGIRLVSKPEIKE
jgi:hypothetical protein